MNQRERLEIRNRNQDYQEKDMMITQLSKVFTYYKPTLYVYNQIRNRKITEQEAYETYYFIVDMFKIKGFDETEAKSYLNDDFTRQLLGVRKKDLISTLSILATVGLDDIALFEQPNILCKNFNQTIVYQIVRQIEQEKTEKSLDNIKKLLFTGSIQKDDRFIPRVQYLAHTYERNIDAKKEESEGTQKTLK